MLLLPIVECWGKRVVLNIMVKSKILLPHARVKSQAIHPITNGYGRHPFAYIPNEFLHIFCFEDHVA
jgi:hypothetical protein